MKRKKILIALLLFLTLLLFPACELDANGSIKSITRPYVAEYECVEARLGEEDLLERYEYIKITLIDKQEMEISFKSKNGKKHIYSSTYEVDPETREFSGEIGILGFKFKEKTKIENGSFTIERNILSKPLFMKFKAK